MPRALLAARPRGRLPRRPSYGLTRGVLDRHHRRAGRPRDARPPLPGLEVTIAGDGEIARLRRRPWPAGGPLHTGDLGRLDAAGRLSVTGRKADLIVTGGENVAPAEVEAALAEHPAVAEAAVFAAPASRAGGRRSPRSSCRAPGARAAAGVAARALPRRLAPFKVPKAFELVDELPRTESGKVRRAALR